MVDKAVLLLVFLSTYDANVRCMESICHVIFPPNFLGPTSRIGCFLAECPLQRTPRTRQDTNHHAVACRPFVETEKMLVFWDVSCVPQHQVCVYFNWNLSTYMHTYTLSVR